MNGYSKPSKETMAKALSKGHQIHPIICDPLSYDNMVSKQKQWTNKRKQVPSDFERKIA